MMSVLCVICLAEKGKSFFLQLLPVSSMCVCVCVLLNEVNLLCEMECIFQIKIVIVYLAKIKENLYCN